MHRYMPKTISISDDVYEKLSRIKGDKSFSEIIRELIGKKGNTEILSLAFKTRDEEEIEKLKEEIKSVERWMQSWIQA